MGLTRWKNRRPGFKPSPAVPGWAALNTPLCPGAAHVLGSPNHSMLMIKACPPPPPPLYSQCPAGWRQGLLHGPSDFRASWAELLELCSALLLRLPPPLPRFTSSSCKACFKDIIKPALSPVNAQQLPVLLSEPCPKHLETAMSLGSTQAIH